MTDAAKIVVDAKLLGEELADFVHDQTSPLIARIAALEAALEKASRLNERIDALESEKFASIERRLSRHAEHLARLEDWKKARP